MADREESRVSGARRPVRKAGEWRLRSRRAEEARSYRWSAAKRARSNCAFRRARIRATVCLHQAPVVESLSGPGAEVGSEPRIVGCEPESGLGPLHIRR